MGYVVRGHISVWEPLGQGMKQLQRPDKTGTPRDKTRLRAVPYLLLRHLPGVAWQAGAYIVM